MGDKHPDGPLHLQRFLTACTDALADVVRSSVHHPVTTVRSLNCQCMPSGVLPAVRKPDSGRTAIEARTAEARERSIESSRTLAMRAAAANSDSDRRVACRFFALGINDEEGVVHSNCRRCNRLILLYDRALYWGIKRKDSAPPPTYPYKCTCGGHAFEVALGLEYPDEALDENDLITITIAVRCASCNEIAVVFDDEAT